MYTYIHIQIYTYIYIYIYIYSHAWTLRYQWSGPLLKMESSPDWDRGRTERPHPQKSDLIKLINLDCSKQAQCCVHLVSVYIIYIYIYIERERDTYKSNLLNIITGGGV